MFDEWTLWINVRPKRDLTVLRNGFVESGIRLSDLNLENDWCELLAWVENGYLPEQNDREP